MHTHVMPALLLPSGAAMVATPRLPAPCLLARWRLPRPGCSYLSGKITLLYPEPRDVFPTSIIPNLERGD